MTVNRGWKKDNAAKERQQKIDHEKIMKPLRRTTRVDEWRSVDAFYQIIIRGKIKFVNL